MLRASLLLTGTLALAGLQPPAPGITSGYHGPWAGAGVTSAGVAASTVRATPECPVPCQGTIACRLCSVKLELYRSWMEEVGRGVEMHPLHPSMVSWLSPFFPGTDLQAVRVGYTSRQVADGLTDCDRIFLARPQMAEAARIGGAMERAEFELFLHELVHVEQCTRLGGRDAYALLWFRDVGVGALTLLLTGGHWMGLHGAMPMEAEAAGRAVEILEAVESDAAHREASGHRARQTSAAAKVSHR